MEAAAADPGGAHPGTDSFRSSRSPTGRSGARGPAASTHYVRSLKPGPGEPGNSGILSLSGGSSRLPGQQLRPTADTTQAGDRAGREEAG